MSARIKRGDPPSPRQLDVLTFIGDEIVRSGVAPSFREIGAWLGLTSTNGVHQHLRALEIKGYIQRSPLASRVMTLTPEGWAARGGDTNPDRFWRGSYPPHLLYRCGGPVVDGSGRFYPGADTTTRYVDATGPRCTAEEAL